MARQYVAVKFRVADKRSYTYESDDETLKIGEFVKVPDRSGDGWARGEIVGLSTVKPSFACKAILGRVEADRNA